MLEGWKDLLPRIWSPPHEIRVHMDSVDAAEVIGEALIQLGSARLRSVDGIVLLCIGTDRSIGDSLGPLIGSQISEAVDGDVTVLGTLDNPVHAGNLVETLERIDAAYQRPLTIAVDACLGRLESVGMLTVGSGSLRPGAGVNKSLPAVGDLFITGVVNVGGFMEYFVLQNTRLSLVMRMAKVAARGIQQGLGSLVRNRGPFSLSD
ncbi:MAG: spore protease YyaC [Bacillota bacterium]